MNKPLGVSERTPAEPPRPGRMERFERLSKSLEISIETRPFYWLSIVTLMFLLATVRFSEAKPLWFDELFTYYISRLSSFRGMLNAARFDGNPPGIYILTHLSQRLFGDSDLATRAPEIAGYWVVCVCMFTFLRRYVGPLLALLGVAILLTPSLPSVGGPYQYAIEARPYGLVFGFTGAALTSWQAIITRTRRSMGLLGLALSVIGASLCHYFAPVEVMLPLGIAELARSLEKRSIDPPTFLALAVGAIPAIFLYPQIKALAPVIGVVRKSPVFWAKPTFPILVENYAHLLGGTIPYALLAICCVAAALATGRNLGESGRWSKRVPLHLFALGAGFLLVPVVLFLITSVRTGYFMDRYALTMVIGVSIVVCCFIADTCSRTTAMVIALVYIASQMVVTLERAIAAKPVGVPTDLSAFMVPPNNDLPLVISNPLVFLPLARTGTQEVRTRVTFVSDLDKAFLQRDFLPEYSMNLDRQIFPLKIQDYSSFLRAHHRFWLYYSGASQLEWLPGQLHIDGGNLEYIGQAGNNILFLVTTRE